MREAVRTFYLDAGKMDGEPTGILKEDFRSVNYSDYTPNVYALRIAAMFICSSCVLKDRCNPKAIEAKRKIFGIIKNTDLWIAGKEVDNPSCSLATNGVPQEEYENVMRSWGNS